MLIHRLLHAGLLLLLLAPFSASAINIGTLTFTIAQDQNFVAKRVLNNNPDPRVYQVSVQAIDRPGEQEIRSRPADGELLFTPKQIALQPGQEELFKFYYQGPKDNKERYYRISFREIPITYFSPDKKNSANLEPIIILDAILVVRPRNTQFKYDFNPKVGSLHNTGNTYFKFLLTPGCDSDDSQGTTVYLRPGDVYNNKEIRGKNRMYIIYDERFIRLDKLCDQ